MASNTEKPAAQKPGAHQTLLLVTTRKGAWFYYADQARQTWRSDGPHFLGHIVNQVVLDPRGELLIVQALSGG